MSHWFQCGDCGADLGHAGEILPESCKSCGSVVVLIRIGRKPSPGLVSPIEKLKVKRNRLAEEWAKRPDSHKTSQAQEELSGDLLAMVDELLALWEAAQADYGHPEPWGTMKALDALNRKAAEVMGEQ